jgi:hypothetical protein
MRPEIEREGFLTALEALIDKIPPGTFSAVLPLTDIFATVKFPTVVMGKTAKSLLSRLAEGLWDIGVGIEPDGHGDDDVSVQANASLFWLPADRGPRYRPSADASARLAVDLAVSCAIASGAVDRESRERIARSAPPKRRGIRDPSWR